MSEKKDTGKVISLKKKTTEKNTGGASVQKAPPLKNIESFLNGIVPKKSKKDLLNQAQELVYEAWEAGTSEEAVALAKKALAISEDCADAYIILAQETASSPEEAAELYLKGVQAGERALGKKTFKEDAGHFWLIMETRPFMRALAGLADCLLALGQDEKAVACYKDLLYLNPNDNQGIRDMLMPCLIELGKYDVAEELFEQYKDDCMASWMYSRALLDFIKHGDSNVSLKSIKSAFKTNKHVPDYLLGKKKLPDDIPDYYGFGDKNEAVYYAQENIHAWESVPGAIAWLISKVKKV
jgi:tetratricopeptide (TPR) repeat protein